jgi:hypothetical protein
VQSLTTWPRSRRMSMSGMKCALRPRHGSYGRHRTVRREVAADRDRGGCGRPGSGLGVSRRKRHRGAAPEASRPAGRAGRGAHVHRAPLRDRRGAPLLAASIGFLVDWLVTTPRNHKQFQHLWPWVADVTVLLGRLQVRHLRQVVAAVTVFVGLVVVYFVLRPPPVTLALEGFFVVVAVALAFQFLPDDANNRQGVSRACRRVPVRACGRWSWRHNRGEL